MDILFLNLVHEEETINIEAYKKLWNTVFPKCDTKFSTYPIISDDEIVRVTSLHELIFDSENQLDSLFLNSFLPKYRKELNFAFYGYKLYPSPFYKLRVTSARIYGHLKAAFFESYLDKTATY